MLVHYKLQIFVIGVGNVNQAEVNRIGSTPVEEHCQFVANHEALQAITASVVVVTAKSGIGIINIHLSSGLSLGKYLFHIIEARTFACMVSAYRMTLSLH